MRPHYRSVGGFDLIAGCAVPFLGLPLFRVWRRGDWDCIALFFKAEAMPRRPVLSNMDKLNEVAHKPGETRLRPDKIATQKCNDKVAEIPETQKPEIS